MSHPRGIGVWRQRTDGCRIKPRGLTGYVHALAAKFRVGVQKVISGRRVPDLEMNNLTCQSRKIRLRCQ